MANIVISGDSSGSVTLSAPAVSGTTVLTLPTTSGTLVVTGGAQTIEFADGSAAAPSITNSGDTNTGMFFPAADTIAFTEGGTESMRIDASGNVGIGKTNPSQKLDVAGVAQVSSGSTELQLQVSGSDGFINMTGGGDLQFRTGPSFTQTMRILASGNVGIGLTNPAYKLDVSRGSSGVVLNLQGTDAYNAETGILFSTGRAKISGFLNSGGATPGTSLRFFTMPDSGSITERMRIDDVGRLWSGSASPWTQGSGGTKSFSFYGGSDFPITGASDSIVAIFNRITGTGTIVELKYNAGVVGSITTNGSTVAYNTSSDYRLKENIAPITGALAKVSALKPVTYTWKATGQNDEGFIAHELAEVCPQAVSGEKDGMRTEQYEVSPAIPATYNEEGNELTPAVEAVMGEREVPDYQGIDTSFLVATLTAAIQEQQAIITQLQADVAALKGAK
jgi:hypothetical protein